ncbi:MAG: hypothetical protein B6U65_03895 [Candidatus Wolframiiraptor sp. EX4484-121]|nr:MAG: hypothetical protein B6U65_03895 [Candidatus Wolframiiraptor sp. EX4484-121]
MSRRRMEEEVFEKITSRMVEFLSDHGISPMSLTISAFAAAIISSILYLYASSNRLLYFPAAITLALSGFLDAVDGAVARRMNRVSKLGAFLDSVFDKLGECFILIAIICSGAVDVLWGSIALASPHAIRERCPKLWNHLDSGPSIGNRCLENNLRGL